MNIKKGYTLDDVLMVPRSSSIESRSEPKVEVREGDEYYIPIMASPMRGIVGVELIKKLSYIGAVGILHRFWKDPAKRLQAHMDLRGHRHGVAIGLQDNIDFLQMFRADFIVIDVANGYLDSVARRVEEVKTKYPNSSVVAGNVVTKQGAKKLRNAGADLVRVGIGNGSLCTTRDKTGVGYPQLSALLTTSKVCGTIADGGIKTSGDMAKALAAGAKFVMLGSLFATALESENNGIIYGMASRRLHEEIGKEIKSIEGREAKVVREFLVEELINDWVYGIKSAMTYLNATNLTELKKNVKWVTRR